MTDNTLQKISQDISSTLDGSLLLNRLVTSIYDFCFQGISNQTAKYLQYIGLFFMLKKSISAGSYLIRYIWKGAKHIQARASFDPPELKDRFGIKYWTLVVGADNELGKCFCKQFAILGFDLVIVGTNEGIMAQLLRELKLLNPYIRIKTVRVQLFYKDAIEVIEREIEGLDIGLVVNNCQSFMYETYQKIPKQSLLDCMEANVGMMVKVCQLVVPKMKQRVYKGGIINVTSGMGVIPTPYTGLFSAGTCFADVFSRALSKQRKGKINVLSLRLFSTFGSQLKACKTTNSYGYVVSALKALGNMDVAYGTFWHQTYLLNRQRECQSKAIHKVSQTVNETVSQEHRM